MRFDGFIKSWNDERGFGFIEPTKGGQEIFFHIQAFRVGHGRPDAGQPVSFELALDPRGRKRAKNVEPIKAARHRRRVAHKSPPQWGTATLFAIPAFLVIALVVSILWRPPLVVAGIYAAASVAAFMAYALDKRAAQRGAGRTPESTLHVLALLGGWPGALIAQQSLRHKTSKASFRLVFWGTVAVNVLAFVALSSPVGHGLWAAL